MTKVYQRTENGTVTHISIAEAMAEVNTAMMDGKRDVKTMSSGRGDHRIQYKDGRKVTMILVDAPEETTEPAQDTQSTVTERGNRIVTVKGKKYVVGTIVPADRPVHANAPKGWVPQAYVSYWSERNGERFGATRTTGPEAKPGTIGRAIWDAVNR